MATAGGPGRPKKYESAKKLSEAVNAYFASITKKDGTYKRAPSVAGLCLSLGISRSTWYSYADDADMAEVVDGARLVMEDYWTNQLAGKFANGAKFALGAGFGWNGRGRWSERDQEEAEGDTGGVVEIPAVEGATGDGGRANG